MTKVEGSEVETGPSFLIGGFMRIVVGISDGLISKIIRTLDNLYSTEGLNLEKSKDKTDIVKYIKSRLSTYISNMVDNELEYIISDIINEYYEEAVWEQI